MNYTHTVKHIYTFSNLCNKLFKDIYRKIQLQLLKYFQPFDTNKTKFHLENYAMTVKELRDIYPNSQPHKYI